MDRQTEPIAPPDAIPKFDSKAAANAEYHRIMTGAATFQQMVNAHVVQSARTSDPFRRAEELEMAIRAGERMLDEFRRARRVVSAAAPLVPLPDMGSPPRTGFQRPGRVGPEPVRPKPF